MARNSDGLTPRQRQSRQIMQQKAALKKRKAFMRKFYMIGGGVACVLMTGVGIWGWKSGAAVRTAQSMTNSAYGMTVKAGFAVQSLYLEGRNRTSMEEIDKALEIKKGDPILQLSIGDVRERLEKIESIKVAAVERALPDSIYVRIVEREPVALWQSHGKMTLVDDNGVSMNGIDIAPYQQLPLIIGDSAPQHVKELMGILSASPDLTKRFSSAIRVSDRRWNIRLNSARAGGDNDVIEVRLPESNPSDAWKKLADLQSHQQVLDRNIKVIDLRLDGKIFIKLTPDDSPAKAAGARET